MRSPAFDSPASDGTKMARVAGFGDAEGADGGGRVSTGAALREKRGGDAEAERRGELVESVRWHRGGAVLAFHL